MSHKLRIPLLAALSCAAVGGATAPPAGAAANPYTAAGVCGAGFRTVSTKPVDFPGRGTIGRLVLMHRAPAGGYCAVVLKTRFIGVPTWTDVSLKRDKRVKFEMDGDFFGYYAGPVYLGRPKGSCFQWRGSMQEKARGTTYSHGAHGSLGC